MKLKKKEVNQIKGDVKAQVLDELANMGFQDLEKVMEYVKGELKPTKKQKIQFWAKWVVIVLLAYDYITTQINSLYEIDLITLLELIKIFSM